MENAPPLLIMTAQPLFYRTLADHLGLPCKHLLPAAEIDTHDALGMLLIPENTNEINQMNTAIQGSSIPSLMLLRAGSHRAEPACPSLERPVKLRKLEEELSRILRQPRPLIWPDLGSFDPKSMKLTSMEGSEAMLTEKEAALLNFLSRSAQPVTREELLEGVWRYHPETETHTLETHLYRLRQKLRETFGEKLRISSDEQGYCLISG